MSTTNTGSSYALPSSGNGSANAIGSTATSQPLTGPLYVITPSGGFSTTRQFDTIQRLTETIISQYDVTGAVEVLMDVRLFNHKIGVMKDSSNINLVSNNTNYVNDAYVTDSLHVSAAEFVADLSANPANVVSVGILSALYSDFAQYVATYYGFASPHTNGQPTTTDVGFATLFSHENLFHPNDGVFDANAFLDLIDTSATDLSGGSYSGLSSSIAIAGITISDITRLLRNAVDANPFGNRNRVTGTTASDVYDRANYQVSDGFFADDLFFITDPVAGGNGLNITLKLAVTDEAFAVPLNNVGANFNTSNTTIAGNGANTSNAANLPAGDISGGLADSSYSRLDSSNVPVVNLSGGSTNINYGNTSTYIQSSSSATNLISRSVYVPLLIRLVNKNYMKYTSANIAVA